VPQAHSEPAYLQSGLQAEVDQHSELGSRRHRLPEPLRRNTGCSLLGLHSGGPLDHSIGSLVADDFALVGTLPEEWQQLLRNKAFSSIKAEGKVSWNGERKSLSPRPTLC